MLLQLTLDMQIICRVLKVIEGVLFIGSCTRHSSPQQVCQVSNPWPNIDWLPPSSCPWSRYLPTGCWKRQRACPDAGTGCWTGCPGRSCKDRCSRNPATPSAGRGRSRCSSPGPLQDSEVSETESELTKKIKECTYSRAPKSRPCPRARPSNPPSRNWRWCRRLKSACRSGCTCA